MHLSQAVPGSRWASARACLLPPYSWAAIVGVLCGIGGGIFAVYVVHVGVFLVGGGWGVVMGMILNRPRQTAGGYFKKNYRLMAKYTAVEDG